MIKEAIVLAGGLGTRLRSEVPDRPKCMALVAGRPFLEYVLDYLIHQGIQKVVLSVGYLSEAIGLHFGERYRGLTLTYATETHLLGTGGAIRLAMQDVTATEVAILNGDSIFLANIQLQYQYHVASGAESTLALHNMQKIERYGTVTLDSTGRIRQFREKQSLDEGHINAGVYIFNAPRFRAKNLPEQFSIEKDYFEAFVQQCHFAGFPTRGYFLDIGIPEDFRRAQQELPEALKSYLS